MSNFLYHEACPRCPSSDAFAVYEDGHKYCFSCGHRENGTTTLQEVERSLQKIEDVSSKSLPLDFTYSIPREPYAWLKQYELTNEEIISNHIGWSPSRQLLIFPYYGAENENEVELLCWQGRYFPKQKPKSFTSGLPDKHLLVHFHNFGMRSRHIVVVEDSVSAIKVSRFADSCVLWGSNLSLVKAARLGRLYPNLLIWLDPDKTKEMIKFQMKYKYLFNLCDIVVSEKDPKEHTDDEIQEYLGFKKK